MPETVQTTLEYRVTYQLRLTAYPKQVVAGLQQGENTTKLPHLYCLRGREDGRFQVPYLQSMKHKTRIIK